MVKYRENNSWELRSLWNIAKHDDETFTVAWSTLHSKISCAKRRNDKVNDWEATKKYLVENLGGGKQGTSRIGRWFRAAQGLD